MSDPSPAPTHRIVYCRCTYARVVPAETKDAVLAQLTESGVEFEAVADLCEMSARKDPALQSLATGGPVCIAACYPRAVKWLFSAGEAPLDESQSRILNMRTEEPQTIVDALLNRAVAPESSS